MQAGDAPIITTIHIQAFVSCLVSSVLFRIFVPKPFAMSTFSTCVIAAAQGVISDGKEEDYAWLAEIEAPNVYMRPGNYAGPSLQE